MNNPYGRPHISRREKFALAVAGLTLLALALGAGYRMLTNKPKPERRKPPETTLTVSVRELVHVEKMVTVPVQGTVVPAAEVDLKSRVSGEVIWTSAELVEGGIVKKGQALVKIDPTEYELALVKSRANLESAVLDLKTEEGRQEIAKSEWEILGLEEKASDLDRELALRRPQLAAFEAKLEAARADVRQAELNLERTVIRSPFNAAVLTVSIDTGAQAAAQGILARLAGSDTFYVKALIPADRLGWINIPEGRSDAGSAVSIRRPDGRSVSGEVFKLLPDLQPGGLQARLLIKVKDPLDLGVRNGSRRPLLIGDFVNADIEGRQVREVFSVDREHLRDGGIVYLVDENETLEIRKVVTVWSETDAVLVKGLTEGERLVVSDIPAPVEGMAVRIADGEKPGVRSQESGETR